MYTETLPSSFRFNTIETVDTVFSKLLIANLFKDQTFQPGVTFTDKYNEKAGQIYMRRIGKVPVKQTNALDANGLRLEHTNTKDALILIQKKDRLSASEECYDLVETLRASGKSVDKVNEVLESFKEKNQMLYMSYLLATPANYEDIGIGGATLSATTTRSTTITDVVASILKDREQIRVNGGMPDTLIVSPHLETIFLANALTPGNAFIPETNETLLKTGKLGRLYGLNVYTSNLIGDGVPLQIPVDGNAPANIGNAANCEYIIYDKEAFGICGEINGLRVINAIDFFGSLAQIEGVFGGGIVNPALAYAKITAPEI